MRGCALCGSVLVTMLSVQAIGREEEPAALRWSDVIRRIDGLPQAQEALNRVRGARAVADAVGQIPNPEAEFRLGRGTSAGGGPDVMEWGVALTIPFDWIGPRGGERRAARSEADAADWEARAVRREVTGRLARLFWEIAHGQQLLKTLGEAEAQAARLAAVVRIRVEKGESRPTELPRVEIELEQVRQERDRVLADLRADRAAIEAILGLPEGSVQAVEEDGESLPEPPSREETIAKATRAHPRLEAALARVRAREDLVAAERARRIPGFSLGGFFERERDGERAGGLLMVRIPAWNWNSGAIRRAEAERAAEERAAEAAARELLAETLGAWERCSQARIAAERFREEILPRAEAAARTVERGYEMGEFPLIDVLDARRMVLDARKSGIEALLRVRVECTALAVLTGGKEDAQ